MVQDYIKERQGDPSTKPPAVNPLMMGLDPTAYVLKAVASVKVTTPMSPLCAPSPACCNLV